jgi:thioredoxin-related protein
VSRPALRHRRHGFVNIGTLALIAIACGCALLVGQRLADRTVTAKLGTDYGVVAGSDTAPSDALTARQALGSATATDVAGKKVPLVIKGQPTIVMLSSRSCSWCKKALKDFGEMADGRPVPRLTVLTLEGAAEGVPMLEQEGLRGARLLGPAGSREQALLLFRYPGTPTFVALDKNGRVVHTIPGYPIRPELLRLFSVMVGDSETP